MEERFVVHKDKATRANIICKNTMIMLSKRVIFENNKPINYFNVETSVWEDKGDDTYFTTSSKGDTYILKIFFTKLTSAGQYSPINDFLKEYASEYKIIVAPEYNSKIYEGNLHNTQFFKESILLQDILSYRDQPRFEILSPQEIIDFKKAYSATEYTIPKYTRSDPVVRYFALKKGDIVRIIRPSPTSGESVAYRIVN